MLDAAEMKKHDLKRFVASIVEKINNNRAVEEDSNNGQENGYK